MLIYIIIGGNVGTNGENSTTVDEMLVAIGVAANKMVFSIFFSNKYTIRKKEKKI